MKVLWFSNSPFVGTGYGQQTDLMVRSLAADGHDVAISANFGLQGSKLDWNGFTMYPSGYDPWSNDVVEAHAVSHFGERPGWVITLVDVFVLAGPWWNTMNVASWCPVDHLPIPPKVANFFRATKSVPIAMSEFGRRQMELADLECFYAPHGIDTRIFSPQPPELGGKTPREMFGLPDDAFVVTMNAANKGNNPIRKAFPEALTAFSLFAKKHKDAILFLHTERHGMAQGVRLDALVEQTKCPKDRVLFVDQAAYKMGLPNRIIAGMYHASDVLLAPSLGEGFGIPVVEAQACGKPVIVNDFSAQPELVGSGWAVGGVPLWDEPQKSFLQKPDIGGIVDALECAYDGQGVAENAVAKAAEYDHQRVYDKYWRPILRRLEPWVEFPDVTAEPVTL